jgi:hypothetical protein
MRTLWADLYLEKIDGKEGSGNGEGLLWHARSRRHGHRFLWFLLHLKKLNVALRAEPITKKVQQPKKVRIQHAPASYALPSLAAAGPTDERDSLGVAPSST